MSARAQSDTHSSGSKLGIPEDTRFFKFSPLKVILMNSPKYFSKDFPTKSKLLNIFT